MEKLFGLIGEKLSHSFSVPIHHEMGIGNYALYEMKKEQLGDFLNNGDIGFFNVTIPYKREVIKYMSSLSEEAKSVESVNTVIKTENGLCGFNTDISGFMYMLRRAGIDVRGKKALVLGSGGASHSAVYALGKMGCEDVTVISRSSGNNYENLCSHCNARIIVNATPVGMYPETDISPVSLDMFPQCEGVADMIYNPGVTKLLYEAEKRGIPCTNGLSMLVAQAKASEEIYFGKPIDDGITEKIIAKLNADMKNIVLVGMPGCGKSTVGAALAELTGKNLVDTDREIEKLASKSLARIFSEDGEERFRELEREVIQRFGREHSLIIATGGGSVKDERNYYPLHSNGRIYYLFRSLRSLKTDGRPLSQSNSVETLYNERKEKYKLFGDCKINNNRSCDEAAAAIKRDFYENTCN